MTPEEVVTTPPVETPAPEPVVEAAPPQPGPWAADAEKYFAGNTEAQASFDRYMREIQQPRITELEAHPGRSLHADIVNEETRDATVAEVIEELYGADRAEQFKALFGEEAAAEPAVTEAGDPPAWAKPLLERDQATRDREAQEASAADYAEQLAGMRTKYKDLRDEDMELIHPFIAIATDTDEAYNAYQAFTTQFKAAHGITPAEAAEEETPPPPAVLGTTGAPAAAPPVQKQYPTLDDAFDDFFNEQRAQVAPPVL